MSTTTTQHMITQIPEPSHIVLYDCIQNEDDASKPVRFVYDDTQKPSTTSADFEVVPNPTVDLNTILEHCTLAIVTKKVELLWYMPCEGNNAYMAPFFPVKTKEIKTLELLYCCQEWSADTLPSLHSLVTLAHVKQMYAFVHVMNADGVESVELVKGRASTIKNSAGQVRWSFKLQQVLTKFKNRTFLVQIRAPIASTGKFVTITTTAEVKRKQLKARMNRLLATGCNAKSAKQPLEASVPIPHDFAAMLAPSFDFLSSDEALSNDLVEKMDLEEILAELKN